MNKTTRYETIVVEHSENIYSIALLMVNDRSLAADISQDVFIRIYRGLPKFKGKSKLSTWIYRITRNVCYDYYNKSSNKFELVDNYATVLFESKDLSPDNLYERSWENEVIQKSVLTLPRDERMAISLYYYFDNSYKNIADIMGKPIGTIKSHIHRGKKNLKAILEPILELEK